MKHLKDRQMEITKRDTGMTKEIDNLYDANLNGVDCLSNFLVQVIVRYIM